MKRLNLKELNFLKKSTLTMFMLIFGTHAFALQVANYIGTGSDPHIKLVLSANGTNTPSYAVDYGNTGGVPTSSNSSDQWSAWNIVDSQNHYYGTVTLNNDGQSISWNNYSAPNPATGYYVDLSGSYFDASSGTFDLKAKSIHQGGSGPSGAGPFPNAPLAQPMLDPAGKKVVLSVQGKYLVDENGNHIILKGVVRPSLEWSKQGQFLSAQDIQNMAQKWNADAIRIDLNQQYWMSSAPATTKGSYKQIVNAIVYYAMRNHMAVILDLHWTDHQGQSPMANKESITFWKQVANDYKDFGTVLFELFNEPYGISKEVWKNGDSQYAGFQQLYNAVRSVGAKNVVIIGGLDYAYDLSFVNSSFHIDGSNIMYNAHPYDAKGRDANVSPGGTFDHDFAGVINNYPLIFTEFGDNQAGGYPNNYSAEYQAVLKYADEHGVSYTAFAWWVDSKNPAFPTLISSWSDPKPINGGKYIFNDMQQVPGSTLGH